MCWAIPSVGTVSRKRPRPHARSVCWRTGTGSGFEAHGRISPMSHKNLTLDLVIPIYNEEGVVEHTHKQISDAVDPLAYEICFIYVDDGSRDGTADTLRKISANDSRVVLLQLSRNFGHQAALTAGMDAARGDVVVTLDGDGQHPPEMIP